ncbi:MAG: GNAT family N-acetyltransferase [Caulobacteraceae bacterium]
MNLAVAFASEADAGAIVALRNAAGDHLAQRYALRPSCVSEKSVSRAISTSRVLLARSQGELIATLRLATKKPWAIDFAHFTPVARALYLHDLAVLPKRQRQGVGSALVDVAKTEARSLSAQAIRLDAYDAPHGAGAFYARCGFNEVGRAVYRSTRLVYFELLLD